MRPDRHLGRRCPPTPSAVRPHLAPGPLTGPPPSALPPHPPASDPALRSPLGSQPWGQESGLCVRGPPHRAPSRRTIVSIATTPHLREHTEACADPPPRGTPRAKSFLSCPPVPRDGGTQAAAWARRGGGPLGVPAAGGSSLQLRRSPHTQRPAGSRPRPGQPGPTIASPRGPPPASRCPDRSLSSTRTRQPSLSTGWSAARHPAVSPRAAQPRDPPPEPTAPGPPGLELSLPATATRSLPHPELSLQDHRNLTTQTPCRDKENAPPANHGTPKKTITSPAVNSHDLFEKSPL